MISGLHEVTVNVSDLTRATAFYGGPLNLRLLSESPERRVFELGGMRLVLRAGARPRAAEPKVGVVLTLRVRDVFSLVEHLRSEGVPFFGEVRHDDGGNVATFADPDGNVFRLIQPS